MIKLNGVHVQAGRYFLATVLSASITIGFPILLVEALAVTETHAVGIAFICAFAINFLVMRWYVFKSNEAWIYQARKFIFTSALMRGLEYGLFLLSFRLLNLNYVTSLVIVLGFTFVLKFIIHRVFVFTSFPNTLPTENSP